MNKILIVGHPRSGYEEVEALLNVCGMASAQPSRREGYLPQQISATLCKAHNASTLQRIEAGSDVQQIEAGPVWHGLALDLMLGNLDQAFWGWSDPQSIFLLDYWFSLDPAITFVLVYDKPQSVLTRLDAQTASRVDSQTLQQRAQGWAAYNAALLHFFLRHPRRCLLVHTQQVRESAASYLQQMRARIDAPWSERMDQLVSPLALTDGGEPDNAGTVSASPAFADVGCTDAVPHRPPSDALTTYLADALLSQHTTSLQLYEEMQASANLPLGDEASHVMPAALDAWQSMVARQLELQAKEKESQERLQTLQAERAQAQAQAQAQVSLETRQRESEEENELLLNQLHQVQEELERYYLEAQKLKQKAVPAKPAETVYYGAGQRIRQQLSYKLGATMIERSRSVGGWFGMPVALIRIARQHKREKPQRDALKLPPINRYRDAAEAERYRQHLSYRLGNTLLKNVRSPLGWICMPWAVKREVREYRQLHSYNKV